MTNRYVRSTDGDNADSGATWALAKATITGASNIDVAGDYIFVSDNHAESTAAVITFACEGDNATPSFVICVDDSAEPPTALAETAEVTSTGTSNININGGFYMYGIIFNAGTGASTLHLVLNPGNEIKQTFEKCKFKIVGTSVNDRVKLCADTSTAGTPRTVEWKDCEVSFASASQQIEVQLGLFIWRGGRLSVGSSAPSVLFDINGNMGRACALLVEGVDLSGVSSSCTLVGFAGNQFLATFRNCKLPASFSGSLGSSPYPHCRLEMFNCSDGDTNYDLWIEDYSGSIVDETTVVRTGGASDGTTTLSWKMTASANAEYPHLDLRSPEIVVWNETVGSAITITVEVVHDSQGSGTSGAFTDKELWLDVQYLGNSGSSLGSFITDAKASVLATAADQASSSATWTTTGLTTPVKQKLSVTFTPQEKGPIIAKVCLTKASAVVYVDADVTVS